MVLGLHLQWYMTVIPSQSDPVWKP